MLESGLDSIKLVTKQHKIYITIILLFLCGNLIFDVWSGTTYDTVTTSGATDAELESDTAISNENSELYEVVKVVDGDTVDLLMNGRVKRVRLIGINTPELVDPRREVECFGLEASNKAKAVLQGKLVRIESDKTQADKDKYDRLLRYVFLEDGTNFNELMIKEGYAYEYTYDLPYKYQAEFRIAEQTAKASRAGLWGEKCE